MGEKYCILIIGANRGIGYELTKRFLSHGHVVYGSHRPSTKDDPSVAQLAATGAKVLEVDFTVEESIMRAATQFGDQKLDILINCAGIYNLWDDKAFTEQTAEDLMWFFKVNVIGPFLTSKHFLPALQKAKLGKIINVSSDMASISDNTTGGNACYRIAKCALNNLTKTQAEDLKKLAPNVLTLAVHPGYVATKMTGFYGEDDMQACMDGFVRVAEAFGREGEEERLPNGGYVRWNGEKMNY